MKKKPKLPTSLKRPMRRLKKAEERADEAIQSVPRITNETVAEHREEVLSSARKYIYPLQHSRHRIVMISSTLLAAAVVLFLAYCAAALYKLQTTSSFIYEVTRVLPFPSGRAGSAWLSYESYLFELRHNMHYYETQNRENFDTKDGQAHLKRLKQQALDQVTRDAYIKQLAHANHVSVSDSEVNNEVELVRQQNRLGSNAQVFDSVLNEFWGWNEQDFKRELKQQLLAEKVVSKLDTGTHTRAENAYKQLQAGADFAALAGQVSEDPATKGNGGQYPGLISPSDRDVAPQVTDALFKLKPGQVSPIINTGYSLEIVKLLDMQGDKAHAAHIAFNFQDISTYTKPLEAKNPPRYFITP